MLTNSRWIVGCAYREKWENKFLKFGLFSSTNVYEGAAYFYILVLTWYSVPVENARQLFTSLLKHGMFEFKCLVNHVANSLPALCPTSPFCMCICIFDQKWANQMKEKKSTQIWNWTESEPFICIFIFWSIYHTKADVQSLIDRVKLWRQAVIPFVKREYNYSLSSMEHILQKI